MSKAVLISIRPEWCEKILSGEKTVEIRKTRPKLATPFKVYIYCTKARKPICEHGYPVCYEDDLAVLDREYRGVTQKYGNPWGFLHETEELLTSKVIAEFTCDEIKIHIPHACLVVKEDTEKALAGSCLSRRQVLDYLMGNKQLARYCDLPDFYGWHIRDLKIYDQPKSLDTFTGLRIRPNEFELYQLERPPQSWCYVADAG